jgi:hypothetical protein
VGPGFVRPQEIFQSDRRPGSSWNPQARQVGFMSTQKRENRWQRMSCVERAGAFGNPGDRLSLLGRQARVFPSLAHIARYVCAIASGETAPLLSILWSAWAWFHASDKDLSPEAPEQLATKFLQSDCPIGQLVQPVIKVNRRGSPPSGAGRRGALGMPASPRSSLPHIPCPSGFARFHHTLPQAPAGIHRRAERYDGKRDMYFQHAA